MKRLAVWAVVVTALVLATGAAQASAQSTFTIPYKFQAGEVRLPKGDYSVVQKDESHITLRQEATGKEFQVPFTKRLAQPSPPSPAPRSYSMWLGISAVLYGICDRLRAGRGVAAGCRWIPYPYHEGRPPDPDHQRTENKIAEGTSGRAAPMSGAKLFAAH